METKRLICFVSRNRINKFWVGTIMQLSWKLEQYTEYDFNLVLIFDTFVFIQKEKTKKKYEYQWALQFLKYTFLWESARFSVYNLPTLRSHVLLSVVIYPPSLKTVPFHNVEGFALGQYRAFSPPRRKQKGSDPFKVTQCETFTTWSGKLAHLHWFAVSENKIHTIYDIVSYIKRPELKSVLY